MPLNKIILILTLLLPLSAFSSEKYISRSICLYDPAGHNGDLHAAAVGIQSKLLNFGVKMNIRTYTSEGFVQRHFEAGECDAIAISGTRGRQYNKFAASLEALGAFDSFDDVIDLYTALSAPEFDNLYIEDNIEIAGLYTAGLLYPFVNDASLKDVGKMPGKKILAFQKNEFTKSIASALESELVRSTINDVSEKFKTGKSDMVLLPFSAAAPLGIPEYLRDSEGGFLDIPVYLMTVMLLVKKDRFPDNFGKQARGVALNHLSTSKRNLSNRRDQIKHLEIKLNSEEKLAWKEKFKLMNQDLINKDVFDSKMIKIIESFKASRRSKEIR